MMQNLTSFGVRSLDFSCVTKVVTKEEFKQRVSCFNFCFKILWSFLFLKLSSLAYKTLVCTETNII